MISNLQVLRGLAALAVVFYHTAFTFNGGVHTDFQAVSAFFVVSGFIMTYITREDASQFLQQRLIRIVPLYWLCTLAAIAPSMLKGSGRLWEDSSFGNIVNSLLFIPYRDGAGDIHPLLAVGWTLNLEMFFYVLFATMLVVSRRLAPLLTCLALIAIKIVHQEFGCNALLCEFYAHDYTTFLIAGVLSYYVWSAVRAHATAWRSTTMVLASLSFALFVAWNCAPALADTLQQWFTFPLFYLMPPLLVTAALLLHSARAQWRWKIALVLGDASYALYLTHTIVMEAVRVATNKLAGDRMALLNPNDSVWAMAAILIVCSLVAIVVHYRVEVPMLRSLRGALIRKPARPQPAPLPQAEAVLEIRS
jgi:exopolysaccharide production protein ExoZ